MLDFLEEGLVGSAKLDGTFGNGWSILSLTQVANSQSGEAYTKVDVTDNDDVVIKFDLYCGDGTGADGLCMNLGGNDLGGRVGEGAHLERRRAEDGPAGRGGLV